MKEKITSEQLDRLRKTVSQRLSKKRFSHTLAVEEMTARLCALFCPEHTQEMRAAALLHDITKECLISEQYQLCKKLGLSLSDEDMLAHKTLHARTAAALIPLEFEEFSDPLIVNAVRWHTTGHEAMTLTEMILYFADYIDDTRTFENCVWLRQQFWDADPQSMPPKDRKFHFETLVLISFDMTIKDLIKEAMPIAKDTVAARNHLLIWQKLPI